MQSLLSRLRVWTATFFDELWRLIPAQPILFPFFLIGAVLSLCWPPETGLLGPGPVYLLWVSLSLLSPLMVLLAWRLVMHHTGKKRYIGLRLRLGGDAGQFFVLATYLLTRLVPIDLPDRVYGLSAVSGCAVFVLILVARDLYALWFVEQVASNLSLELNRDRRDARQ